MKIGIMQPYFFPYIGYISLIRNVDRYILLDSVQFIRHGWIERNRILKQSGGWHYISVPLKKHSRDTLISDIEINNNQKWKEKIIAQLGYYKGAPYYYKVMDLIKSIFSIEFSNITSLNCYALKMICEYLGVYTPIDIFSEMNLEIEPPQEADEWALNICKSLPGITEYWNPIGGIDFFDRDKYLANNIEIYFQKMHIVEYKQKQKEFEPGLSILDVMMFNSPDVINYMLDEYELL